MLFHRQCFKGSLMTSDFSIRDMRRDEYPLLETFLYEAIFQKGCASPLPRTIVHEAELSRYFEGFGGAHDRCLVAECDRIVVGAVWVRLFTEEAPGFGFVDAMTPELSISLLGAYRNRGIGTDLVQTMLRTLREKRYLQVSLSVQRENPAIRLYRRVGFSVVRECGDDCIMLYRLASGQQSMIALQ